jgi:hypothetical protein
MFDENIPPGDYTLVYNRTAHTIIAPTEFVLNASGLSQFSIITDASGVVSSSRENTAAIDSHAVIVRPKTEITTVVDWTSYVITIITGSATVVSFSHPVKVHHQKPLSRLQNRPPSGTPKTHKFSYTPPIVDDSNTIVGGVHTVGSLASVNIIGNSVKTVNGVTGSGTTTTSSISVGGGSNVLLDESMGLYTTPTAFATSHWASGSDWWTDYGTNYETTTGYVKILPTTGVGLGAQQVLQFNMGPQTGPLWVMVRCAIESPANTQYNPLPQLGLYQKDMGDGHNFNNIFGPFPHHADCFVVDEAFDYFEHSASFTDADVEDTTSREFIWYVEPGPSGRFVYYQGLTSGSKTLYVDITQEVLSMVDEALFFFQSEQSGSTKTGTRMQHVKIVATDYATDPFNVVP